MASRKESGAIVSAGLAILVTLGGYKIATDYSRQTFGDEHAIFDITSQVVSSPNCKTQVPLPVDDARIVFSSDMSSEDSLPNPPDPSEPNPYSFVSTLADENELTVFNSEEVEIAINNAERHEEVIEEANTFTSNFGIEVTIPNEQSYLDANKFIPFKAEEYDLEDFKGNVDGLTQFLSRVPEEVVELGNIKTLNIVSENNFEGLGTELISNKSPDNYYNPYTDNMYIELNKKDPWRLSGAFAVSASSAIDIEVCGLMGAQFDNVFTDFENAMKDQENGGNEPGLPISLEDQLRVISEKGILLGRYLSPGSSNPISAATLEDRNKVWFQILRINEHVPGYADFWKNLALEYSGPFIEGVIIDNETETTA